MVVMAVPEPTGVGVIVPYDMALDRELWRWTPEDVTLYFTRTPYADLEVNEQMARTVSEPGMLAGATRELTTVEPAAVLYACTSGSFIDGVTGEARLVEAMESAGAAHGVTTSGALLAALDHLGVSDVAVATPYDATVTERLHDFLAEAGAQVVSGAHLGLSREIWKVPDEVTVDLIRRADSDAATAVFVSCTNLPTYDVIASLEAELGKPVLTANQVSMWSVLRQVGRQAVGSGQRLIES